MVIFIEEEDRDNCGRKSKLFWMEWRWWCICFRWEWVFYKYYFEGFWEVYNGIVGGKGLF